MKQVHHIIIISIHLIIAALLIASKVFAADVSLQPQASITEPEIIDQGKAVETDYDFEVVDEVSFCEHECGMDQLFQSLKTQAVVQCLTQCEQFLSNVANTDSKTKIETVRNMQK